MRKRWFRQILRRRVFVILLLALQIYLLVGLIGDASRLARWTNAAFRLLSVLVGLRVVSGRDKPSYKLLWVVLMLVFPVFGGLLYLLVSFQRSTRWADRRLSRLEQASRPLQGGGGLPGRLPRAARPRAPAALPGGAGLCGLSEHPLRLLPLGRRGLRGPAARAGTGGEVHLP